MYTDFQVKRENYTLTGYKWAAETPKALVVLIHGMGEHAGRYAHVAMRLCEAGYTVYAPDMPGHGRSEGKRGHIGCSYEIVKIVDDVIIYAKKDCPDVPVFVMGHSMGGNIALAYRYYRRDIEEITGYVSSSPWLMLADPKMEKRYKLGVFAAMLLPKATFKANIGDGTKSLCKNPTMAPPDEMCHGRISLQTAVDRERDARLVTAKADEGKPVYLFNGSADSICLPEGAHLFRDRAGKTCTYKEWEGLDHETMNEDVWKDVVDGVIGWLDGMVK